ncbi:MAG: aldehyde dehydrogenase family protein [Halioglobus sp.]|nr:aldehyde dehydrogenase family protein [Halioglobus sp.]
MRNDDSAAIAELHELFDLQRAAYFNNPEPTLQERVELIQRIPAMMLEHHDQVLDAMHSDYGNHPALTTTMFDFLNVLERAQHALENIESWMQPDMKPLSPELYGSSTAYIRHQPKGVIGNLAAWNFPFDISIGPLVDMLAAGNRVIIKPSEQVPACGDLMKEMITKTFDPQWVAVVTGGIELASHFSTLRWDHLLYTGNTRIGREVALKAAENLVPVTLELGGKNPTVFTEDAVNEKTVRSMLRIKFTKNGQLCINADHAYVPSSQLDNFLALVRSQMDDLFDDFTNADDICTVINERQWARLQNLVQDARERDHQSLIEFGSPAHTDRGCRMPFTLVCNPAADALVSQTEIFGPMLPVYSYDSLDEVITRIQQGERPLGVYMFSNDQEKIEQLRRRTASGGFTLNCCSLHGAQANMGFGGVGHSGTGRHHGYAGFCEFSNPRGHMELADDANIEPLLSPHRDSTAQFVQQVLGGAGNA